MEPITLTVVTLYVAQKFIDQFIKEEGYGKLKTLFFPKQRYINRLVLTINQTIDEYGKKYPTDSAKNQIQFFQSAEFFDELTRYILFKNHNPKKYLDILKNSSNVATPTNEQLVLFFSLLTSKIKQDSNLKKLFIEDNYQTEIFALTGELSLLSDSVNKINADTNLILEKVNFLVGQDLDTEPPVLQNGYVSRNEEQKLWETINDKGVLLLSGVSFCGKSQLAKRIATRLYHEGYKFIHRNDVNEAQRAIMNSKEKIILLLEDPFGHNFASETTVNYRKVQELIKNKPALSKIIITSRSEIVKSINQNTSLADCLIEGNNWFDLTTSDTGFLIKTWQDLCVRKKIDDVLNGIIDQYLKESNNSNVLQPGQLNYLSNLPNERVKGCSLDQLLLLAKADSKEIANEMKNKSVKAYKLFLSLGFTADTNTSVTLDTLGYILNEQESLIGVVKRSGILNSYDYASNKAKPDTYPSYKNTDLPHEYLEELGFLQSRGFITVSNKQIYFCHPTYREAARSLSLSERVDHIRIISLLLERAISCIELASSINAAKQLIFIYNNSKNSESIELVKSKALEFTETSIFPAVCDICFTFLLENISQLPAKTKESILGRLRTGFFGSEIRWHNEIPYIDTNYNNYFDDLEKEASKTVIELNIQKLNSNIDIPKSDIWAILIHIQNNTDIFPDANGLMQILRCDEIFIRNKIAFLTLKKGYPEDEKVLKAFFNDTHPSVVFQSIKGALMGYPYYNIEERRKIKLYLTDAFSNDFVIIRANNLFSTFSIDYGGESIDWKEISEEDKLEMWQLWATLFPIFLRNYPKNLSFSDTGRFGVTLDESIKYLSAEVGLDICNAYYQWLNKYIENGGLPDTYELGLLPYLLDITKSNPEIRFFLFEKIFRHTDTNYILYSFYWCLGFWESLTNQEKECLYILLKSERIDIRWLRSVCLTTKNCPAEIQILLVGQRFDQNSEVEFVLNLLAPSLLQDCLSIFCGYPRPFSDLGLSHSAKEVWYKIIKWILKTEYEVGFEICLRELVFDGVNGLSGEWREDGFEIWDHLCKTSKNRKRLATQLVYSTSRCSCVVKSAQKFWHSLIDSYLQDNVAELISLIVENIEALQYSHPEDLLEFYDRRFLEDYILPSLPFDKSIIELDWKINRESITEAEIIEKVEYIMISSKSKFVKLKITFDYIIRMVKDKGNEFTELKNLLNLPNQISELEKIQLEKMNDNYELQNWVSVRASDYSNFG